MGLNFELYCGRIATQGPGTCANMPRAYWYCVGWGTRAVAPGEALTLLSGDGVASCCCFAMFSDRHQHTLFFCSCECASKVNKHSAF